jgi:hypothetical protein
MISIADFRERLRNNDVDFLLNDVLLCAGAMHVKPEHISHVETSLASKFAVPQEAVKVWIVGSAKLGFSLTEKRTQDGSFLQRYRLFSAVSDIDVAVVSPAVFDLIWNELSAHAHRATRLPWESGHLGDYLVCGWLRPDHFPNRTRLRRCDDWWDVFRALSVDTRYGRRRAGADCSIL